MVLRCGGIRATLATGEAMVEVAMLRRIVMAGVVLVAGCSEPAPPASAPAAESVAKTVPAPAVPQAAAASGVPAAPLRGYFEDRDGGLFTACDETWRRHAREVDPATLAALKELAGASAEPLFIAAQGRLLERDGVEIGALELAARDESCETRLHGYFFAARGNDPFWTLEAGRDGVVLRTRVDAPAATFAYADFVRDGDAFVYADADGALRVRLEPGPCRDSMAPTVYALRARIEASGQHYEGCAWRGDSLP